MDFKCHLKATGDFLRTYRSFWYDEILNYYPEIESNFNQDWIEYLDGVSNRDLWKIDGRAADANIQNRSFKAFFDKITELCQLPKNLENIGVEYPARCFTRVKGKKKHEIGVLGNTVGALENKYQFSHAVDIGGGVGHLSRIISHYHGLKTKTLDKDLVLQETGKSKLDRYRVPENAKSVEFIPMTFGQVPEASLREIFTDQALSIGLHTCGPLAVAHLETAIKHGSKALLNFGCCYTKLNPLTDCNISSQAKADPITFTKYGLTLATRGHCEISYQDFQLKERVKAYRYSFHLLLWYRFGIQEFRPVGDSHPRDYWGSFSDYASNKLRALEIAGREKITPAELNSFFADTKVQKEVRKMFLANIIRWQAGRVVEHYLLTDRALFLEERGYQVSLKEYFDQSISPRNIGILALAPGITDPTMESI
ncbi:MAG: methyltransferase [Halobacteriovoraceae bacterium]|jgi:hypothetical protein|nr:methyltransferase [Halobacteriovoraceae bacterium]MBT5095066.1 methyltransferase [Halobacteriovoraceae bacterium]